MDQEGIEPSILLWKLARFPLLQRASWRERIQVLDALKTMSIKKYAHSL